MLKLGNTEVKIVILWDKSVNWRGYWGNRDIGEALPILPRYNKQIQRDCSGREPYARLHPPASSEVL